jgi:integrase
MARLLKRPRSPFWYVEFKDATGNICRESTKCKVDTREGERAANRILNKRSAAEKQTRTLPRNSAFSEWVVPFIHQHATHKLTRSVYLNRWNMLTLFLNARDVKHPCQLTYAHCQEYVTWRISGAEIEKVSQNTARDDLGTLRFVMNEAVKRDYAPHNPCLNLRIKSVGRKERQELTDEQIEAVRLELKTGLQPNGERWHDWMPIQFEIGLHTGRRLSETKIAMGMIDLERGEYTVRVKGGKIKTKPIHSELLPLLKTIKGEFTHNVGLSHSSRQWRLLFDKLGLPHISFHNLRVTFVSRCRRAGIDRWTAMQLCDHASAVIHEAYNRYQDADLRAALLKLEFPTHQTGKSG